MKTTWQFSALLGIQVSACAGILAILALMPQEKVATMQRWEYSVAAINDDAWETTGREIGQAGWDMVSCRRAQGENETFSYECIFKRPVVEVTP